MGALILTDGEKDERSSPERAAQNLARLKQAGVHFTHGLSALKRIEMAGSPVNRKALALAAALQLNLAHVALELGEPSGAGTHAEKALEIAKKGLLPQYEWRALMRLGDLKAALKTLSAVTMGECRLRARRNPHRLRPNGLFPDPKRRCRGCPQSP